MQHDCEFSQFENCIRSRVRRRFRSWLSGPFWGMFWLRVRGWASVGVGVGLELVLVSGQELAHV